MLPPNPYEPNFDPVKNWKFTFGTKPFEIHTRIFTLAAVDKIIDKLAEIRAKQSIHAAQPAHEGESFTAYQKRIAHTDGEKFARKPGESAEEWTRRQFMIERKQPQLVLELMNLVLEIAGQSALEYKDLESTCWIEAKEFVFSLLWLGAGIYVDELVSPKSTENFR